MQQCQCPLSEDKPKCQIKCGGECYKGNGLGLAGPMRYSGHFTPILPKVYNSKQVENRVIKLCDFCAASVMASPWSALGHLLCPEQQCRGAHGHLLTLIYLLIPTLISQHGQTQENGTFLSAQSTLCTAGVLHVPVHHSIGSRWDQSHIVRPPSKTPPHPPQGFTRLSEHPQVPPKLQHFPVLCPLPSETPTHFCLGYAAKHPSRS